MAELWFGLLCFLLTIFVVLDGWNIGAGVLHLIAGRTASERREIIAAIGPSWSWHEVWLIAFGGTFLLAFPKVMATSFAGFYLALWFVLWAFILRSVSIEVGGHIFDRLWQSWWDFVFAVSSVVLAVLFGAALGNVIRGVPLDESGKFSMSLFTLACGAASASSTGTPCRSRSSRPCCSQHMARPTSGSRPSAGYTSEANAWRAGYGQPQACCLRPSRWRPPPCDRHCTAR
jgi:cytochrome bd-type quinol oxidase subunit 2